MRIGVLGLGFMGSTHLQALARIPGVELGAVMDLDEARLSGDLSGIQGNLGGPGMKMDFSAVRKHRNVDDILADRELDAVDICLPTHLHAPATIRALREGKHVIVEKPMALDGAATDGMLREAARSGKTLMVAQALRFMPSYSALADLVRGGRLGHIHSAIFRRRTAAPTWAAWANDRSQGGGGVFDLLIHDVDMSQWLFGIPQAVSAAGYEDLQGGVDMISAEFHYSEVDSVTITGGWHHVGDYPFSMEYTVVGEGGVADYSSVGRPATVYWADGKKETLDLPEVDCYQAELEYFLDCCRRGQRPELCPPEESSTAVKLTRLMADARERRGEKVLCRL